MLEEVQLEVKREEEKRSELQLQFTRDRCSWELEKAELKRRIAQLEARDGARLLSVGLQTAAALHQKRPDESPRWEREEQRRLLSESQSAMDLRCRLEHSERDWLRERAELLERFDTERREWECQLKDMQRKIEELYCEVRAKRVGAVVDVTAHYEDHSAQYENHAAQYENHTAHYQDSAAQRLSTGSSLLSDNSRSEPLSSSSQSEQRSVTFTAFGSNKKLSRDSDSHSAAVCADALLLDSLDLRQSVYEEERRRTGSWRSETAAQSRDVGTEELDSLVQLHGCAESVETITRGNDGVQQNPSWTELNYGSEKKRNTTALNAALKEIARVSEELCSYQQEIRQKSVGQRNLSEDRDVSLRDHNSRGEALEPCDLSQIYDELRALEREHWVCSSPDDTRSSVCAPPKAVTPSSAPPIPPRSSSWNLSSPPDTDLHIPESPLSTARKCTSPCAVGDRKCTSPSIVRKFEAMLQENEGKVLMDGCAVPVKPSCSVRCCRWSCDASKFSHKASSYGTVQKSFSELNIVTAAKHTGSDFSSAGAALKKPLQEKSQAPVHLSAPELPPASPVLQGSRRNLMLEQKTAEFNRCLFQAEMGRGVEEQDASPPHLPPMLCQQVLSPRAASGYGPVEKDIPHSEPRITKTFSEAPAQMICSSVGQPAKIELEVNDPATKEIQEHVTNISGSSGSRSDVRLNPSPKINVKATGVLCSERCTSEKTSLTVDTSSSESDCEETLPSRARPSAENKHRPTAGRHVSTSSDNSRPALRTTNEHPWKQLTLAAYPRPEGSRSNYGAVERILKNYENAAKKQSHQRETASSPNLSMRDTSDTSSPSLSMRESSDTELDTDPTPLFIRETLPHWPSAHKILQLKEMQLTAQESPESSTTSSSIKQKNFSRPARPANRRLPSRWAGRSPSSRSPPSFSLHKHSSFTYSRAFRKESVIL